MQRDADAFYAFEHAEKRGYNWHKGSSHNLSDCTTSGATTAHSPASLLLYFFILLLLVPTILDATPQSAPEPPTLEAYTDKPKICADPTLNCCVNGCYTLSTQRCCRLDDRFGTCDKTKARRVVGVCAVRKTRNAELLIKSTCAFRMR
jgi:hypothetical protein